MVLPLLGMSAPSCDSLSCYATPCPVSRPTRGLTRLTSAHPAPSCPPTPNLQLTLTTSDSCIDAFTSLPLPIALSAAFDPSWDIAGDPLVITPATTLLVQLQSPVSATAGQPAAPEPPTMAARAASKAADAAQRAAAAYALLGVGLPVGLPGGMSSGQLLRALNGTAGGLAAR